MPSEFEPRRLARRAIPVIALLGVAGLVIVLAPGLGEVRDRLADAKPGWLALGVAFEALSCLSYVLMFRPIFCRHMHRRTSWEIAWAELAMGSIVPASGAGGLALGAWILRAGGMPGETIARRSVAFFLIKSAANFVAVAVIGTALFVGVVGPDLSPWLTIVPAVASVVTICAVFAIGRLPAGDPAAEDAGRIRRFWAGARIALVDGVAEATRIIRSRSAPVLVGSLGYWFWDNAVLWATYHAFGAAPAVTVVLMGYLIGQLGGALPLPGRSRRHRRRPARHARGLRCPGGGDRRCHPRLPRHPLLAAARRRGDHLLLPAPRPQPPRPARPLHRARGGLFSTAGSSGLGYRGIHGRGGGLDHLAVARGQAGGVERAQLAGAAYGRWADARSRPRGAGSAG